MCMAITLATLTCTYVCNLIGLVSNFTIKQCADHFAICAKQLFDNHDTAVMKRNIPNILLIWINIFI